MMIDAVMYGMIPSANTANWVMAPPEKACRKLEDTALWAVACRFLMDAGSMAGHGDVGSEPVTRRVWPA